MEWVESTGRTVAEAVEQALDRLGVAESDAEIVVVEEPKTSMFGLRKTEARVRVRVRPVQARAKRPSRRPSGGGDNRQRRGGGGQRSGGNGGGNRGASRDGDGQTESERPVASGGGGRSRSSRSGRSRSASSEARSTVATASDQAEGRDDAGSGVPEDSKSKAERDGLSTNQSRSRSGSRNRQGRSSAAAGRSESTHRREKVATEEEEMSIETQAELAEEFVRGVVAGFGLQAQLTSEIGEDSVRIDVAGENVGLLIGPRGATVDALQELTRTAVQHRSDEHGVRITVDVGGYRLRRAAALQQFAQRIATEVIETGEPQALDPMSAADRKVVHDAANEIAGVRTTSEGEDPRRYVVIHPTESADEIDDERSAGAVADVAGVED
ncbi:MAG: RNA-binding cell elongation regulator Jag/EloR, partial [Acidimicrobiales bacterium]